MSDRELTRLRVMIDLADDRLTVDAAAMLMGLGRRQIYRLRQAFSTDGLAGLASRKRGRPSNRKRGETLPGHGGSQAPDRACRIAAARAKASSDHLSASVASHTAARC